MSTILTLTFITSVLATALALSIPLILGALGGVVSERAGVVNIAIDGMMLTASFACAATSTTTGSLLLGMLAGVIAGGIGGLFLGILAVSLRVDQVVGGFVINIAAAGGTSFVFRSTFGSSGSASTPTLPQVNVPVLSGIPVVGQVLFQQSPLVYLTLVLVAAVHVYLFSTRLGLRARAVGENPKAADVAGINVSAIRSAAVVVSGAFAGLAGAYLVADVGSFSEGMTSGRGFIALAAVIFGKWRPVPAMGGALLFGFFDALQSQLQTVPGMAIPVPVFLMIPYLATIAILAGFIGRAIAPAADGLPYVKE
ncbi:MAG: hypothetical protein NVSMB65_13320 [Chloroflexota bacterium]